MRKLNGLELISVFENFFYYKLLLCVCNMVFFRISRFNIQLLPHVSPESENRWLKYKYERFESHGHAKIFVLEEDDEMAKLGYSATTLKVRKRIWINLERLLQNMQSGEGMDRGDEEKMFDL